MTLKSYKLAYTRLPSLGTIALKMRLNVTYVERIQLQIKLGGGPHH